MPELDDRIAGWKRTMSDALGGAEEIVAELESHLREEIDQLLRTGHTPAAALALAQARLGRPADLAAEYARAAPPVRWWPILICLALPVLLVGDVARRFLLQFGKPEQDFLLGSHVSAIVAGYALTFYAGLLGVCYVACWVVRPIGLGQRRSLGRALYWANVAGAALLLVGILLGMAWARRQWGQAWQADSREIATSLACLWFFGLAGLWRLVPCKQHLWVLLSVIGIGVSLWAWLGPLVFVEELHSYGFRRLFIYLLGGATALPALIALLGALPPGRLRRVA
jgi:hypothetical protein